MKNIIVIGSGWSGSGAVFDYLANRSDVFDPFKGEEFRLIGDPGGLFDLQTKIKHSFSLQGVDHAIKEFIKVCYYTNKLSKYRLKQPPVDMTIIKSFVNDITLINYKGLAAYEYKLKPLYYQLYAFLMRKLADKKGVKANIGQMYYPVVETELLLHSKIMIDKFINKDKDDEYKFCVINHGGTFWNPIESTQCYGDRHVIIVIRDPRDIFVELKAKGNAYPTTNVHVFCQWYNNMMNRVSLDEWKDNKVSIIKFEEFVNDFDSSKRNIDNAIGLNPELDSTYKAEESKGNIGKFRKYLNKEEITVLERELKDYLYTLSSS